jgi:hypothetical protein
VTAADDMRARRARLISICESLPEATSSGDRHVGFEVRGRRFGWYLDDHHGDGRVGIACKAAPGRNTELVESDPDTYFMPDYVGPRGWVGVRLDTPRVDWDMVEALVIDSYRMVAPKTLARQVA